jgi:hypothetical protein
LLPLKWLTAAIRSDLQNRYAIIDAKEDAEETSQPDRDTEFIH